MEELRSTRHWGKKPHESTVFARSAYNDFFRGPPGHTTSFPSRFEDYCEIFGNAASASSIPVLDLPPADEDFTAVGQVVVDYSEIFRGLSGGSFAVSYEELFGVSKRSGVSSLNGRALWGVLPEEQLANLEMAEVSSVPNHSDDASSKKFGTSSYRTSRGIIVDLIGEETKTAKYDAIPEFTVVVDPSDPVLAMKSKQVNKWITNNTDTNRYIHDGGKENEAPSNSSSNGANSENLQVEQAPSEFICDSLLDASQNEIHHSRSSSYHSASSGDIDVEYLNISEISLQTKSLQGPPPSRPPPQLIKKPEHSKMVHIDSNSNLEGGLLKDHMDSNSGASKIHAIDYMEDDDSCCYDNEMDPNSAVAASVAAVKAAMKHAQARLKIAKELMDRKRDKYTRKVDQPDAATCEEDGADFDVALKSGSKVMAANNLLKQNNHSYTFLEWEEIKKAGPTSLKHEKKERFPSSGENQHQVAPYNVLKSTEAACEFDELSGDWKTEKKYYELIRNGSLLNEVKDHYMQENEKKAKTATHGCQNLYKDSKKGEQAFEVLENKKSSEGFNLNGASMAYMKDSNKNVANAIMEDFLLTESASKLNEAYNCHLLNDTQKEGDVHKDSTTEDGDNSLNSALDSGLRRDSEMMFQALNFGFESGADNSFCEGIEFSGAEKISRNVVSKMEFHASHVDFELNESHKLFKVENEAVFQGRSDEKSRVSDGLCSNNTTDKMEVAEETRKFDEKVRERESMRYLYASNVSACKVEESNNAAEVDEADGLQANEEACILTKYELEKERRDTPIELQEVESMRLDRNQEVHDFEFLSEAEINCAEKGSENTSEVLVACNLVENQIISTSAKEIQHCNESNYPVIILSGKEENSPDKAPDTTEVFHAEVAENHRHSIHTEDEEDKKSDTEKERDQKQAMILEEKEREREREKDRIFVERANHDARQREFAEARERAERIAAERVTAVARQRALAESREKAEKAADTEKASREARLRAERAAVERATEEARQRAIEKALAERASIEARSRIRKGNATVHFKAANVKEDSSSNTQSQGPASFTNGQRYSDSWDNGESESKLRCKARQERHQRTAERAAKALAEKNLRDILVQREQAERDRIAESLDSEVRRWSCGKEGNLRALLSTLHYILVGSDSGWQPIPLTDVLTAAAVKKAYRKATLCVHPDKLQQRGATIQQKYICEKVFDLLKEAWNKFNSEEW